jgi:tight adherence protein C
MALIIIMLLFGVFIVAGLVMVGFRERDDVDPLQARLAEYASLDQLPSSLEEIEMSLSRKERILEPIFKTLARRLMALTPEQQVEQVKLQLDRAGKETEPAVFFAQRIFLTIVFGVLSFMLLFVLAEVTIVKGVAGVIALSALGYYFPMMSLNSTIKKRQNGILKALPDALDLLVICVEAGLGFDTAMGKVYEKWDNDLSIAFGRVLQEIQLGRTRSNALRDMSKRLDVPDLTSFTAAIIQAEQLGVSIARILRVQSDQMRIKRRQRAQETAQKAPVKMIFPLVFLVFPSIWIVLLGPSVFIIMDSGLLGSGAV